jgi:hypothetical protein
MGEDALVAYCKALSQHFSEKTDKNIENLESG